MHTVTQMLFHSSPLLIYILVVVVLALESSAIPIANNTLLLFTGALAASGHLNIWVLWCAALLGSTLGACLAYMVGARGGQRFLQRLVTVFHLNQQKVSMVERWCQRSGSWMIFVSRMTPYIRPFACFPAGISRMPYPRFLAAAFSGSLIWCTVMLALAWYLGRRWTVALHFMQHYTLLTLGVIAIALLIYILCAARIKRSMRSRYRPFIEEVPGLRKKNTHDLLHI